MKIVGVDEQMSSTNPMMGDRYFELDDVPSTNWIEIFQLLHRQAFDMMKREVRIQNTWIIVKCPFEEMQHQINFLNGICKKTTDAVEAAKLRARQAELERTEIEEEKQKRASAHFSTLKFDNDQ